MFIVLVCMLCDIIYVCFFNFVCQSKSPTWAYVICYMYLAQNKSSISMSMKCLVQRKEEKSSFIVSKRTSYKYYFIY